MSSQQTLLRVQTNIQSDITEQPEAGLKVLLSPTMILNGLGTEDYPLSGQTVGGLGGFDSTIKITAANNFPFYYNNNSGTLYYDFTLAPYTGTSENLYQYYAFEVQIFDGSSADPINSFLEYYQSRIVGQVEITPNIGRVSFIGYLRNVSGSSVTNAIYFVPDPVPVEKIYTFETLDLYDDVPIKINKSFAELQDVAKRNSDYSIGLTLPGSKKNNRFFEGYYNVDSATLFFDVTKRVPFEVMIDDSIYFKGYLRLNKVSVQNSKIEYDVTLYSSVGDLFGKIGNGLLKDLDFNDYQYHFNHYFNLYKVSENWRYSVLQSAEPVPYFYPVTHNGYEYSGQTVNLSGITSSDVTRLYTTTISSGFTEYSGFTTAGGKEYRINSPISPILSNQLKPALNIYSLIQLMFKTYGYTIKSDFFKTPWFKLLYMYGYFSSDSTKFSYKYPGPDSLPYEGVQIFLYAPDPTPPFTVYIIVVKNGTGIPAYCQNDITYTISSTSGELTGTIPANTSGATINLALGQYVIPEPESPQVTTRPYGLPLSYEPIAPNTYQVFNDGDYVNFGLVMDENLKQIDLLSSVAKKFNLVFVPDPEIPNQIIIEPYTYYVGTGDVHDWTDKISFDRGFTVEPALNYIESTLNFSDLEDGDDGNKQFKDRNKLIYGQNIVYNDTDFKSQDKKIETIFSPEVIRDWDSNVGIPLGINYAASSALEDVGGTQRLAYYYKGLKSKPKLFFNLGNFSPFLDQLGESFELNPTNVNTMFFRLQKSNQTNPVAGMTYALSSYLNPVISHTMPLGNPDSNKINNDSICNLFGSEEPVDFGLGIDTYNAYTVNDVYNLFYANRIDNLYNKSTRFLSGNFYLKLPDVKNLKPNDLIKINEQYFTWNKINNYNLTNKELTNVELIQFNNVVNSYPTRYFQYQYCGDSTIYKFKTDFTPESGLLYDTYYYWSVLYDYFIGVLGGASSGYTSSYTQYLSNDQFSPTNETYAYSIWEVSDSTYDSTGIEHIYDPNDSYFIGFNNREGNTYSGGVRVNTDGPTTGYEQGRNIYVFANQTGYTNAFLNVATGCTQFSGYCVTNHVTLSTPPTPIAVSPTPTPTPSATPSVANRMVGSLMMTFDEYIKDRGIDYYQASVNGEIRDLQYTDTNQTYSTYLYTGDTVNIIVNGDTFTAYKIIEVTRRDYTTDDINGDYGIRDTFITGYTGTSVTSASVTFTVPNLPLDYNFEYRVIVRTEIPASPTPTPTNTPTITPTMTVTPSATPVYDCEITGFTQNEVWRGNSYNTTVTTSIEDYFYLDLSNASNGDTIYVNAVYDGAIGFVQVWIDVANSGTFVGELNATGNFSFTYDSSKTYVIRRGNSVFSSLGVASITIGINSLLPVITQPNPGQNPTYYQETIYVEVSNFGSGFSDPVTLWSDNNYSSLTYPYNSIGSYSFSGLSLGQYVDIIKVVIKNNGVGTPVQRYVEGSKLYALGTGGVLGVCGFQQIDIGTPIPTPVPLTPTPTPTPTLSPTATPTLTPTKTVTPTPSPSVPGVITSGLTFYLDAANPTSYPGSGTTWNDISGNGYQFSLSGSPTYSTTYGGRFIYNSPTDLIYSNTNVTGITPTLSIDMWFMPNIGSDSQTFYDLMSGANCGDLLFGMHRDTIFPLTKVLNMAGQCDTPFASTSGSTTLTDGTWYMGSVTYDGSQVKLYINGSLELTASRSGSFNSSEQIFLGGVNVSTEEFRGSIAVARLYNRTLNGSEVTQNFNSQKYRYGY
jgi:hypothetical protein